MKLSDIKPNTFPTQLLEGCGSGLCLYGAGFYGANDAIHMYNAGINYVTVIDIDGEKLNQMELMYNRTTWSFVNRDVSLWLDEWAIFSDWDIVSVDAPIALQQFVVMNLARIARLARKHVVLSMSTDWAEFIQQEYDVKSITRRNKGTYLVVLEV